MKPKATSKTCSHFDLICLNQHELVRKYRCKACKAIMMCACDKTIGEKFLPHQLREGCELETQKRVPVTLGFVKGVCRECRGLPLVSAPAAQIFGRTSKIKRYYWRELAFEIMRRTDEWETQKPEATSEQRALALKEIDGEANAAIKFLHLNSPKYAFDELSQSEIIQRYFVDVEKLSAIYAKPARKGAQIYDGGKAISVEAFVTRIFHNEGWLVAPLESTPFHALFGVMMWLVICDSSDRRSRICSFGSRTAFEEKLPTEQIWMTLPEDFGTSGYAKRRTKALTEHFKLLLPEREELLWTFDYWVEPSRNLREYLWAHRETDVTQARFLVEKLEPKQIIAILKYLVEDYWAKYLGWPDLLIHKENEMQFVEVKSSNDKLSEDQKNWIKGNFEQLRLPFKLVKVHRAGENSII